MSKLLLNKAFYEYHQGNAGELLPIKWREGLPEHIRFRNQKEKECITIDQGVLTTKHFVGIDWLIENERAIYVQPRLNQENHQTNYMEMLCKAMIHPELSSHMSDLFEIKFNLPCIEINRQQDLLTPLLIVRFISLAKKIVQKGLKKSYYPISDTLSCKIKGKIVVALTIKEHHLRHKPHRTHCRYEVYGLDNLENRLLKKTLAFCSRFLPSLDKLKECRSIKEDLKYILPAFGEVSEQVNIHEIKHGTVHSFYWEYQEAVHIGKLILQRFGYNITNIQHEPICKVPPFWIDMSKLFELYVYNILKEHFGHNMIYQYNAATGIPDFMLLHYKVLIDVKYKPIYQKNKYRHADIGQVCAYARDKKVWDKLGEHPNVIIFYPTLKETKCDFKYENLISEEIEGYTGVFKFGISLPLLKSKTSIHAHCETA